MLEYKKVKLKEVLRQYRNTHWVGDQNYKQVTISQTGEVSYRGTKHGSQIGRKRQFLIDLVNHPKTLIFIRQGVFKNGIGICPPEIDGCLVTENMPMFDIVNINSEFLNYYLRSPQFKADVDMLVPTGTAQKAIHERQLLEVEIPLPPIDAQEEIVKKIKIALDGVKEIDNINEKNESYITKLRQAILQSAVKGELVKQDPKDEPASELLKKIKAEKEKLIKEGKIRKDKLLAPISEEEKPYDLPDNWEWVRLGEICNNLSAGGDKPSDFVKEKTKENSIPVIANGETNKGIIGYTKEAKIFEKSITVSGRGTIGYSCIRDSPYNPIVRLIVLIPNKNIDIKFLQYALSARLEIGLGTSIPQLTVPMISPRLIPLPPISEQKRIVEKVDKLMAYCDELEKQVKENQQNAEKLMGAVLKESFER